MIIRNSGELEGEIVWFYFRFFASFSNYSELFYSRQRYY